MTDASSQTGLGHIRWGMAGCSAAAPADPRPVTLGGGAMPGGAGRAPRAQTAIARHPLVSSGPPGARARLLGVAARRSGTGAQQTIIGVAHSSAGEPTA